MLSVNNAGLLFVRPSDSAYRTVRLPASSAPTESGVL
jgi:hypothetical protein